MTMEYRFLKLKKEIKDSINKFGSTFYYKFYNSNKDKTFICWKSDDGWNTERQFVNVGLSNESSELSEMDKGYFKWEEKEVEKYFEDETDQEKMDKKKEELMLGEL